MFSSYCEECTETLLLFAQDEKTIARLMSDIQETQEILNKHKAESNVRHNVYIFLKAIRNTGG